MLADWVDALADVPMEAIQQAVREYLRGEVRKEAGLTLCGHIRRRALARILKPERQPEAGNIYQFKPGEIQERQEALRNLVADLGGVRVKRVPGGPHDLEG